MSILDTVASDPDPLVVTIDFRKYVDGDKLSTKAREYFDSKKAVYGITDSDLEAKADYLAHLLFERFKLEMKTEAETAMVAGLDQAQSVIIGQTDAAKAAIDSLELVKL